MHELTDFIGDSRPSDLNIFEAYGVALLKEFPDGFKQHPHSS